MQCKNSTELSLRALLRTAFRRCISISQLRACTTQTLYCRYTHTNALLQDKGNSKAANNVDGDLSRLPGAQQGRRHAQDECPTELQGCRQNGGGGRRAEPPMGPAAAGRRQ